MRHGPRRDGRPVRVATGSAGRPRPDGAGWRVAHALGVTGPCASSQLVRCCRCRGHIEHRGAAAHRPAAAADVIDVCDAYPGQPAPQNPARCAPRHQPASGAWLLAAGALFAIGAAAAAGPNRSAARASGKRPWSAEGSGAERLGTNARSWADPGLRRWRRDQPPPARVAGLATFGASARERSTSCSSPAPVRRRGRRPAGQPARRARAPTARGARRSRPSAP